MSKIKFKSQPTVTQYGNHLEQAMLKGLNEKQARWAKSKLKELQNFGGFIHYGLIHEQAKSINNQ